MDIRDIQKKITTILESDGIRTAAEGHFYVAFTEKGDIVDVWGVGPDQRSAMVDASRNYEHSSRSSKGSALFKAEPCTAEVVERFKRDGGYDFTMFQTEDGVWRVSHPMKVLRTIHSKGYEKP